MSHHLSTVFLFSGVITRYNSYEVTQNSDPVLLPAEDHTGVKSIQQNLTVSLILKSSLAKLHCTVQIKKTRGNELRRTQNQTLFSLFFFKCNVK